jgi:hypothetical protein
MRQSSSIIRIRLRALRTMQSSDNIGLSERETSRPALTQPHVHMRISGPLSRYGILTKYKNSYHSRRVRGFAHKKPPPPFAKDREPYLFAQYS